MICKNIVLKYLKEYHIKKISIFGSIARDEHTRSSDIDIVVKFSKPNLFVQAGIMEDLKEKFKTDVDVVALTNSMNPKLLDRIKKEAIYVR